MKIVKLISTHRLDPEKGWDLIVNRLHKILDPAFPKKYTVQYDIYWDGSMRPQIEELAKLYPDHISYYGYMPLKKIFKNSLDYDFVLMPSRFLETFGLSALDFAQFGIPTIGYKKGGVSPFILDSLNILNYKGENEQAQFDAAMQGILWADSYPTVDQKSIKDTYSVGQWIQQFDTIVENN
jgi:glycosyltransferase involved in cell wall biosynthesis